MRAQSLLELDAMAIANHEFDKGSLNVATQILRWAPFSVLAANYRFEASDVARDPSDLARGCFAVFSRDGLKVGVIGMGNLSSMTSIFDQPNRLGFQPINTIETVQFYVDMLRPMVDVVLLTTHLGLEVDQRVIRSTTGIDAILGSHNHIVIKPP